jgi:hypothetical protein
LARLKNWELLDATHHVLYEDPRRAPPAIYARLVELGFAPKRSSVPEYVNELRAMGILELGSNRPRFAPLYGAYLLTDLPPAQLPALDSALEQHSTRVLSLRLRARPQTEEAEQLELFLQPESRIDLLRSWPPQMVMTRGTEDLLRQLEVECSALGATARLFVVAKPAWVVAKAKATNAA